MLVWLPTSATTLIWGMGGSPVSPPPPPPPPPPPGTILGGALLLNSPGRTGFTYLLGYP